MTKPRRKRISVEALRRELDERARLVQKRKRKKKGKVAVC